MSAWRKINKEKATLEKDRWVYQLILEAIERSVTGNGQSLRLIDFEDHQEKLRELHREGIRTPVLMVTIARWGSMPGPADGK